jgi:ketosteroid isomerase-like protein
VIEECRDLGDEVLVLATQRGRGKGSGVEVEARYAMLYGIRDGEIVSFTLYPDAATRPWQRPTSD